MLSNAPDRKAELHDAGESAHERLTRILESITDGFLSIDPDWRVTYVNSAGEKFSGRKREDILGKTLWEAFPDLPGTSLEHEYRRAVRDQVHVEFENYYAPWNRWFSIKAYPSGDGRLSIFFSDISDRKVSQAALAERARLTALAADIGAALTQAEDLQEALALCAGAMVLHLDAAFARIWTLNEAEDVLELRASAGIYTHLDGVHSRVPVGSFKIGMIAKTRQAHLTNNVPDDPRIGDRDWAVREGMVAFAGYPLTVEDRLVGVMGMFARHPLEHETLSALGSVANSIALGIERKRAEAALRESEAFSRSIIESSRDWINVLSLAGNLLSMNTGGREILAAARVENILNRSWIDLWRGDYRKAAAKAVEHAANGEVASFEGVFPTVAEEPAWWHVVLTPILDKTGKPKQLLAVSRDITERKQAESARGLLLAREQEIRRTAELLNDAGRLLAAELDLTRLVQAVTDLATRLVGAQFGAFFHNIENDQGESYLLYTLSGVPREAFAQFPMPRNTAVFGPTFRGEGVVRSDDITKDPRYGKNSPHHGMPKGHLPVRSYLAVPVVSRSGEVIGGLFFGHATPGMFSEYDEQLVTGIAAQAAIAIDNARLFQQVSRERVRVEESNRALRRANADLEQFAYSASHDLQEPLRMVAIYSEMLKRKYAGQLGPEADEYIRYTVEGATRMEQLLNDLLAYTHASALSGAPSTPIDANHTLQRAVSNLQAAIEQSGASISHTRLPQVTLQEVHLEQLFQNLLGNAIKYHGAEPPLIVVDATRHAREWIFSVKDNGIGIDPQYKEQIFGMFKRLHTAVEYSGTGMGLAICHRIIERYGGRIWVDSEPGKGSTFLFTIPDTTEHGSGDGV
jgi:PAS domain S-box-containing protein